MKLSILQYAIVLILLISVSIFAQTQSSFQYRSPKPNSILVLKETTIIFSSADLIDQSSLTDKNIIRVVGSESGIHTGKLILSDDNKTIIFNPNKPFNAGEKVTVTLNRGIKTLYGKSLKPESYSFSISPLKESIKFDPAEMWDLGNSTGDLKSSKQRTNKTLLDTLPSDFPTITVDTTNNPSDGKLFLANLSGAFNTGNYLMILDNDGSVLKYREVDGFFGISFTVLPNGKLSYAQIIALSPGVPTGRFIVMDTTLTPVDTFQCGNGYITHPSDFLLLPNGHAILHASDPQPVDMSQYGGSPNAIVVGNIIQELDESKNVVFQWRSWDYLPITDSYIDLTTDLVDLTHANALALDADGNILYSIRHTSSIISVNRQTGDVNWILGGKRNEFTFINEHSSNAPNYFSFTHDIRVLPNGNITLFDNGTQHSPPYSRGVEYEMDEQNKTATLVWEFRHSPDLFAGANGSTQRLANGNTIIGWGSASLTGGPLFTEVHPDNTIALEFSMPPGHRSFRSLKFPWASGLPTATVIIDDILQGNTYIFNNSTDTTGTTIKFNNIEGFYISVEVKRFEYSPINPSFEDPAPLVYPASITIKAFANDTLNIDVWFKVDQIPQITNPANTIVYHRPNIGSGVFEPLTTSYLPGTNELKVSGVGYAGEFIFGYPDVVYTANPPILYEPANNKKVLPLDSLALRWTGRGFYDLFQVQVFSGSMFSDTVIDTTLNSLFLMMGNLINHTMYFWRVRSILGSEISEWSEIWTFEATDAFVTMDTPNGGEAWSMGSENVIRWETNITDSVRLDLLYGQQIERVIDTAFGNPAYTWLVPTELTVDTSYKIIITSLADPSIVDTSDASFSITPPSGVETENLGIPDDYNLFQNFPNPFNPATTIRYSLPTQSQVRLRVYNSIGENIADLINANQNAGSYEVNWFAENVASGIYFYSIEAIPSDGTEIFRSVRKMILLK